MAKDRTKPKTKAGGTRMGKQSRKPGNITPNACTECKRKRAKCDGGRPCSACAAHEGRACVYTLSQRAVKSSMVERIGDLELQCQGMDRILRAIASDENADAIVQQLREGQTYESIANRRITTSSPGSEQYTSSKSTRSVSVKDESIMGAAPQVDDHTNSVEPWTNVTADEAFVGHLLSLYFCWEYPTFSSFSKIYFQHDFALGRRRFCSSLLVNAILSLACKYSDKPEARVDSGDSDTAGDHFFQEAKALLTIQGDRSLTTIQALALMSLREASCGRENIGRFYASQSIRMAMESELHVDHRTLSGGTVSREEREVRATTFWGCFSLDQAWSLFTRRVPHISSTAIRIPLPVIREDTEAEEWIPYTDEGISRLPDRKSPRNTDLVFNAMCELSTSINQALHVVYTPGGNPNSQEILKAYAQYLSWYSSLPEPLRQGQDFTPSALFVHMYHHCAILLLFQPFLDRRFEQLIPSARDVCAQAAENILTLMRSYRQLHSARRTPAFLPYILSTASIIYLVDVSAPVVSPAISMCLDDLKEISVCHGCAKQAVEVLQALVDKRNHRHPESFEWPTG